MDELLKNCSTRLFKAGDKVRVREDMLYLLQMSITEKERYRCLFPRIAGGDYNINTEMITYEGKVVTIKDVRHESGDLLLKAWYRIEEDSGAWCWRHACFEKIDNSVETDGAKWELPLKVGQKVLIRKNLKENYDEFDICGVKSRSCGVVWQMEKFGGRVATIESATPNEEIVGGYAYELDVDLDVDGENGWQWDISMFEGFDVWKDKQETDAKRETESFPLEVGDLVKIREDLKKRIDKRGYIWSTIGGKRYKSYCCTSSMLDMAGKIAKIAKVNKASDHIGDYSYKLQFMDEKSPFDWDISMFECFSDWIDWEFGGSRKGKKRERAEKKQGNCFFEYKPIIELPPFHAYDYKGRKREFESFSGKITKVEVTIISGDETGLIYLVDNGKTKRIAFDASAGSRFIAYDDGSYTVEGDEQLQKWLTWTYDKDKAKNVNYAIQRMNDFLGGDK